jgi:hypothetical protein
MSTLTIYRRGQTPVVRRRASSFSFVESVQGAWERIKRDLNRGMFVIGSASFIFTVASVITAVNILGGDSTRQEHNLMSGVPVFADPGEHHTPTHLRLNESHIRE